MWYIASNAENFKTAKDIRIFGLNEWLVNMFKSFAKERLSWSNKIAKREYAADIVSVSSIFGAITLGVELFVRSNVSIFFKVNLITMMIFVIWVNYYITKISNKKT